MKKYLLALLTAVLFIPVVKAATICPYQEEMDLNSKAANIKANYEIKEVENKDFDPENDPKRQGEYVEVFEISILNLSKEFYAIVSNNINSDKETITGNDSNTGSYEWNDFLNVTNFTIEIYSSAETSCPNEKIKTLYLTTPRFNPLSTYGICEGLEDYYYCNQYVTFGEIDESVFFKKVEDYKSGVEEGKQEENPSTENKNSVREFIMNNKWYILGGVVLLGGIVAIVGIKKSKKQKELK